MNLTTILEVLKVVPAVTAALPQFKSMFDEMVALFDDEAETQETLKEAYEDLIADNDEGFARLDAKLEAAKSR